MTALRRLVHVLALALCVGSFEVRDADGAVLVEHDFADRPVCEHDELDVTDDLEVVWHDQATAATPRRHRFDHELPDGPYVVEQQAYYRAGAEGIEHLRIVCSGFRPR